MAFAPPVSRGNFHYSGDLYVEIGPFTRHRRATVEEITTLLRPDLKTPKTTPIGPPKDQVGHWYEAQLIHYGLAPSKDKARAKMRLLEALNSSKLIVPPNVVQMENEMKKEYASAERKAKAQHKASQASAKNTAVSPAVAKKRKQSELSKDPSNINNINVNINMGNVLRGLLDGASITDTRSPAKKAKAELSKSAKKKTKEIELTNVPKKNPNASTTHTQLPAKRVTAELSKSTKKKTKEITDTQSPAKRVKAQLSESTKKKTKESGSTKASKKSPGLQFGQSLPPAPTLDKRPIQTARSAKLHEAWLKDPTIGPGPVKPGSFRYSEAEGDLPLSSPFKQDDINVDWSRTPKAPSLGLINGLYDLSCPEVEEQWSCTDLTLTLSLDGATVWGAYDLGIFSGIVFLPQRPWQASNEPLPFTWRGTENGEGEMSFGDGCEGEICFLGDGRVEGWIGVAGRCDFEGTRRAEAGTSVRGARSMREEWEGYDDETYEEERRGRWR